MGVKTLYEYFYKLAYGAKGTAEHKKYVDNLDIADARIEANKNRFVNCADYDHPDDAITAISTANKTLLVTEAETCDTNFTVPANVTVKFERGGKWTINTGITVTFNGQIDAGLWQIFVYTGTGIINGNPLVDKVYPHWWINAGTGLTGSRWTSPSNTAGIQEALDFLPSSGGIVFLQSGYYRTRTTIHLSTKQVLVGTSINGTYIDAYTFAIAEPVIENVGDGEGIKIENLKIQNYLGSSTDIIHFTDGGFELRNLSIKASNRHGIYLEDCWYSKISNCMITYSSEIGVRLDDCNGMLLERVFIGNSGYAGVDSVTPYGIYDYCGRANSYIGCSMENATGNTEGVGIKLQGVRSALITGCYIEGNSLYGIYSAYQNATANGSNISIIGNYITSSDTVYGIYLHSGTLINVSNNHITGNKSIEILVAATNIKLENNTAAEINNASTSVLIITGKPKLSAFAATTSAELAGVISDETGSGKLVFATEGEWTMGVSFGGGTTGITYNASYVTGYYTKIGNLVTISGWLALTNKGTDTGSVRITGLPFTSALTDAASSAVTLRLANITFANQFQGFVIKNTTTIELGEITEAGVITALTDADFANNSGIILSCTYRCQ